MREDAGISIGIIGVGMVGEPIRRWFQEENGYVRGENLFCYDTSPTLGYFDDVNNADIIFVCVPTPPKPDGSCNTDIVRSVVGGIASGRIVVIKSTVTPGTTQLLQDQRPELKLMFCPEFLTESQAWLDFQKPARQLIGVTKQSMPHAIRVLLLLPEGTFQQPDTADYGGRQVMTATEAEFVKYASNIFGAVKVCLSNVWADVAWLHGQVAGEAVSYEHIRKMVAADQRIGRSWLDVERGNYAGFGGYCFPKDLAAFIAYTERLVAEFRDKHVAHNYLEALNAGLNILKAVYEQNRLLLEAQGLTVADVSQHDKDIILAKHRPIRVP